MSDEPPIKKVIFEDLLLGETPIDDSSGLLVRGIQLRNELNAFEARNIPKALVKYFGDAVTPDETKKGREPCGPMRQRFVLLPEEEYERLSQYDADPWTDEERDLLRAESVEALGWEGLDAYQDRQA